MSYNKMLKYVQITENSNSLLTNFITLMNRKPSPHFRYYNTRPNDQYRRHIYTVVLVNDGLPIAYGHIEFEDKYWIAICVLERHRGKGHGSSMLEHLINIAKNKRLPSLSLSVDKDNEIAMRIYKWYNFVITHEYEKNYLMSLNLLPSSEVVSLNVSYGDAFDKLAILHIKKNKVSQEKRMDVEREYDIVLSSIAHLFTEDIKFYYKHLIDCSIVIWDKQVEFRVAVDNKTELCEQIIFENDRRGKLKNKINKILSSYIVEQKDGYVLKKAFVSTCTGLGDLLTAVGIVRYLATIYDRVLVYTTRKDQFDLLYGDDDTISCVEVDTCPEGYTPFILRNKENHDISKYSEIFNPFINYVDQKIDEIPTSYYKQLGLKEEYFFSYFYMPSTKASEELYSMLEGKEYIVIHSTYFGGRLFTTEDVEKRIGKTRNEITIIDIDLSGSFSMKNVADYKDLLINASELYLVDSYLFCLALNLELKSDKCYYVSRWNDKDYSYIYQYLPNDIKRKRFEKIIF